jgi:hypothetical protein
VGDAFMPYLGAPFLAQGSPEGLIETIDTIRTLGSRRLVHGHSTLADYGGAAVLPALGAAVFCSRLVDLFTRAVFAWQRRRGRLVGVADPRTGGCTVVQRFGSAINLNVLNQ